MGQYAIIGLGEFGMTVARTLADAGHETLCIDARESLVQRAASFASQALVANVKDREALAELPLKKMDAVVLAIGASLEASVLATLYLKELGVERLVAKATGEDDAKILRALGVEEIVSPEREMGVKTARQLMTPNYVDYIPLQPGISVREFAPPPSFLGEKLRAVDLEKKWKVALLAVRDASKNDVQLLPSPDLVLESSDRLIVLGRDEDLDRLGKVD